MDVTSLYTNIPQEKGRETIGLFADDALLYGIVSSMENGDQLQEDLRNLEVWQSKWQMSFNPAKCKTICLSTKKVPPVCLLWSRVGTSWLYFLSKSNPERQLEVVKSRLIYLWQSKQGSGPQESERNCIYSYCSAKARIRLRGLGSLSPKGHKFPRKSTEESGAVLHKRLPPNCQCNRYDPGVGLANIGATEKLFSTYITI